MPPKVSNARRSSRTAGDWFVHPGQTSNRPVQNTCRALIPLDTGSVRQKLLRDRSRAEKALWKAELDWKRFVDSDQPAYRRWVHSVGGPLRADVERLSGELNQLGSMLGSLQQLAMARMESFEDTFRRLVAFLLKSTGKTRAELRSLATPDWLPPMRTFLEKETEWLQEQMARDRESLRAEGVKNAFFEDDDDGWDDDEDEDSWEQGDLDDDEDLEDDEDSLIWDLLDGLGFGNRRKHRAKAGGRHSPPKAESESARSVRSIYRELCRKLHPDSAGEMTPARRDLWAQVQTAYERRDQETLEALLARVEMDLDPAAAAQAAPSRLLALIRHLKDGLRSVRTLIRRGKRDPAWGFAGWPETKRAQAQRQIQKELEAEKRSLLYDWRGLESDFRAEIARALRSSRPSARKPRKEQVFFFEEEQSFFDFEGF